MKHTNKIPPCFAIFVPSKFSSHGRGSGVGRSRPSGAGGGSMSMGASGRGNPFSSATRHKNSPFNFFFLTSVIGFFFSDFTTEYKYGY